MLDKNDLQAIAALMQQQKEELTALMQQQKEELTALMQQQKDELTAAMQQQKDELTALIKEESRAATSRAIAYSEGVVETKLDAIKEGLDLALETHIPIERIERIEENVIALKSVVRRHSEEIEFLKKAQ